ncbi:radical SAM protein, partial [Candidatus Sumerlaeota bacterium]|nr:radical SAM protein [Candidatus Sumerlaeota bacterium]
MNDKEDTKSTSFSRKLSEILERIRKEQTDGISELKDLSKDYPDVPEILGHLAWALAHKQRYEEAINIYRKFQKMQPEDFEVQWRIADRLINLGRLEEALEEYQKVFNEHSKCIDARIGIQYAKYLLRKKNKNMEGNTPIARKFSPRQEENKILNKREFQENRLKLKSLPSQLYLESTTKCNYYCQTCIKGYVPYYAEDLHQDIFDKVHREIMPAVCRISITGFGEPTMASRFDDILEMALRNGSHVHFVTNASLLNFERIEQFTRASVDIQISIDGASRETFEEIRAGSSFQQICERLAMIKKLRDIYLSDFYSRFSFNFVAIRKNIHELPSVVELAHRFGITDVSVSDYAFGYREFDEQSLRYDPQKANHFIQKASQLADSLGVKLHLPPPYESTPPPLPGSALWQKLKKISRVFPTPKRFPRRCHSPWMEPYIKTNGVVT